VPAARLNNASCVSVIKSGGNVVLPSHELLGARFFKVKDQPRDKFRVSLTTALGHIAPRELQKRNGSGPSYQR